MKLCYGSTRTVLLVSRWALKFPALIEWRLFLLGLLANMQERTFSRTGWPELCPVLWSLPGGWLVIMPRAEPLTRDEFASFNFESFVSTADYTIPAEHKLDSFGWFDGKIVAVDYG